MSQRIVLSSLRVVFFFLGRPFLIVIIDVGEGLRDRARCTSVTQIDAQPDILQPGRGPVALNPPLLHSVEWCSAVLGETASVTVNGRTDAR